MATVEQTMMKVQRILTGAMGLRIQLHGTTMVVQFSDVSTRLHIDVTDWGVSSEGEPRSLVRISAPILWAVKASPDVYEWVARDGGRYFFGHVTVYDDTDEPGSLFLLMQHTLLGDYLDQGELEAALWGVLGSADQLDDELQQRFGGKRLADV